MDSLQFLHGLISRALLLFTVIAGVYGLVEYYRKQMVSPSYWGVIVVGNLAAVAQGALGLILALSGKQPEQWVHILYGVVALMWIPIISVINNMTNNSEHNRRETLIVALISLFEAGIVLRAITTA
jgi:CDP-diglyceride synthetase